MFLWGATISAKRQWLTPENGSSPKLFIIPVPNSPQGIAQMRGILISCTNPEKYIQEYGITPEAAAAEWEISLSEFEAQLP